jgi:hypothetical protein
LTHFKAEIICQRKDWLKKTYRQYDAKTLKEDHQKGPLGYKVTLLFPQMQLRKFKASMARCAGIVSMSLERALVQDGVVASFPRGIVAGGSVVSRRLPSHIGTPVGGTFTPTKEEMDKLFKS